jgi:hypothetical protein
MAAVFLVLFLVTFPFDTRIGFFFLVLSIVMLYKGGASKRLAQTRATEPEPSQRAWKDPWGTGTS